MDVVDAGTEDTGRSASHAHAATGPKRVGPYVVEGVLGAGGMGAVYRAYDPRLHRRVAIKCMRAHAEDPRARARFWREARALAALGHPGVVRVYDVGEDAQHDLYIAMELVDGHALRPDPERPWSVGAALTLGIMVARALGAAHAADIVHRDVKPSNVMVGPDGHARLIDFGLAARAEAGSPLTAEHTLLGTIGYLAPEQVRGQAVTPATDVHAVGLLLHALLTGAPPYQRESRDASIAALLAGEPEPLAAMRADVPAALVAALERCIASSPAARFRDGDALADALDRVARELGVVASPELVRKELDVQVGAPAAVRTGQGGRAASRRRSWWVIGALALALGGVAALVVAASGAPGTAEPEALTTAPTVDVTRARSRVAILALEGEGGPEGSAPRVSDLVRDMLPGAHEGLVVTSWEELFARALVHAEARDDVQPLARLAPEQLLMGPPSAALDLVVRGRVEAGPEPAITLELLASDGRSERVRVPGSAGDPFAAAERVVTALLPRVGLAAIEPPRAPTRSRAAWVAYMAARRASHLGWERASARHTQAAIEADPTFVLAAIQRARALDAVGRHEDARLALANAETQLTRGGRVASMARLQRDAAKELVAMGPDFEAHLARWPGDLQVRLDKLRRVFRGQDGGSLGAAAEEARAILVSAPATPIVASRLVRALAWRDDAGRAGSALAAVGLTPDTPGMASVFGELALYTGDYDEARALFARAREPDGELTSYAAHMRSAAAMLAGDFRTAAAELTSLIERALQSGATSATDWTYLLLVNAHIGAGALDTAREALDRWGPRTGDPAGAELRHRTWRLEIDALQRPRAEVVAEIQAAFGDGDAYLRFEYLRMLVMLGADRAFLEAGLVHVEGALDRALDRAPRDVVGLELLRQSLLSRLAIFDGDPDRAARLLEELTRRDGWDIRSEGDLFVRTRWLRARAQILDEIGRPAEAEVVWREILDSGYARLLVMDTTLAARRRLGLGP